MRSLDRLTYVFDSHGVNWVSNSLSSLPLAAGNREEILAKEEKRIWRHHKSGLTDIVRFTDMGQGGGGGLGPGGQPLIV